MTGTEPIPNRVDLGYLARFGSGKHLLRPSVAIIDRDLDGRAMAQDGYGVGFTYGYTVKTFRWVTTLRYASLDGDAVNPIFGKTNDSDRYSVATQLFFPGAFGFEKWVPNITVLWGQEDSDIEFNKIDLWFVGASLFRKF